MHMAEVDDLLAHPDDKPTIGLLLCRSKNNIVVEYAIRNSTMTIGIAEWITAITTHPPDDLTATLPRIEDIRSRPPHHAARRSLIATARSIRS